jgi:hypothetical protein
MPRLVTHNGNRVCSAKLVEPEVSPQTLLDMLCSRCFLVRPYYLRAVSSNPPFSLESAEQIRDIMLAKGATDPVAFALGQKLKLDWHRFESLK